MLNGNKSKTKQHHLPQPVHRLHTDLSKIFHIKDAARIEGIFEVFNLFNAENRDKFRGDLDSTSFGTNTVFAGDPKQGDQRLAQIGFRI